MRRILPRSLRASFTVGLGIVAATLLVVAVVAVSSLRQLGGAIDVILRENYASVIACEDMNESLERLDSAAQFASAGHEDIARPMLAAHRVRFTRAFEREAHNVTLAGEGERVRHVGALYGEYVARIDRIVAAPPAERRELYFDDLLPRFTAIKHGVQEILRMNQAAMLDADRAARAMARRSARLTFVVSAAALALAVAFAWLLPRAIVRPVRALAEAARDIGEGDLDLTIAPPALRELSPLAEALTRTVAQLRAFRASSLGELLAAKDLAQTTVECLLDPVIVFGNLGEVLLTNAAASTAFGLRAGTRDELVANEVSVPPGIDAAFRQVLTAGEPVGEANLSEAMRWQGPLGERYYLVRAAPLADESGARSRVIVVAQEVTRLRRIDELKSDMVATVSHEFKTPLTSLRMATHMLLEPPLGPLSEAQRELVTTARNDTERLRAMVDELLDLVRIEAEAGALRRAPIDAAALLSEVAAAHRALAREKNIALDATVDRGVTFTADAEKLSIVISNLVANAIRHTPDGGTVRLGASHDDHGVTLTVRDTGEGMAPAAVARYFARATVGPGGSGSRDRHGLGPTIAREIVLQHGGDMRVESEPGRGSTFSVFLPG